MVKKKTKTKKKASNGPKWIVIIDKHESQVFNTDKDLQSYIDDDYPYLRGVTVYRVDSKTKFKYDLPALGMLKEVK